MAEGSGILSTPAMAEGGAALPMLAMAEGAGSLAAHVKSTLARSIGLPELLPLERISANGLLSMCLKVPMSASTDLPCSQRLCHCLVITCYIVSCHIYVSFSGCGTTAPPQIQCNMVVVDVPR